MSVQVPESVAQLAALDERAVRALTEELHAYADHGIVAGADGLWAVYPESGSAEIDAPREYYVVDGRDGAWHCDCPWSHYNPGAECKHAAYVRFLTGDRAIPPQVDRSRLGGQLRLERGD